MLGILTHDASSRTSEYRNRKGKFAQQTFRKDEAAYAISQGWELVRENQHSDRYQKIKPLDEHLENEVWCLLYNLGYPNLNIGRSFQIQLTKDKNSSVSKQIDVFAYDAETVIVCECKSAEMRTKRMLAKDIGEFSSNQRLIANALRKHFGNKLDQKIIWMFVTKNIEWSGSDRTRAVQANIKVITEREFAYYQEIAKRIGPAARYQFHAEFLENTKVSALEKKICALRTKLGPWRIYSFMANPSDVLPTTFVNHRDLRDPESAPSYQRLVHRPRVKSIAEFIKAGGYFPNSVIIKATGKLQHHSS